MLSFLRHLTGLNLDEATVFNRDSADSYLSQFDGQEPDDLAIAAVNRGNRGLFIQLLAHQGLWLALRLDRGEYEGDLHVLEYEEADRRVLPVFSSLPEAMAFVHTVDMSELLALQYMHVSAAFLSQNDLSHHKIVMNPYAGATTEITEPDLQALRSLYSDL